MGIVPAPFWPYWRLMQGLIQEQRAPRLIVLENVCGTLNSHDGRDFATICNTLGEGGYSVGALVVDASLFIPQSRPRLFIICPHQGIQPPDSLIAAGPEKPWHTTALLAAFKKLPAKAKRNWIWWSPPVPPKRTKTLADVIEEVQTDVDWFSGEETRYLLSLMSDVNREKLKQAKKQKNRVVGGLYRRTKIDESGRKVQRAEIRFDAQNRELVNGYTRCAENPHTNVFSISLG